MSAVCYLVSPRGFCSGVNRAVNMVEQVLKLYKEIYIMEDIIHNKVFMKSILEKGVIKVSSVEEIPDGKVVMFSAHGVSPEIIAVCEKKGLTIVDGTCPIVSSIQNSIKKSAKEGKTIILIGNRAHPEIIGMMGCANNRNIFVVSNELEVNLLPDMKDTDVVYYTQTTLDENTTAKIISVLKAKIPHIESDGGNNICHATTERQKSIKSIASKVDLVIVAGSKYSSNTMSLIEVASRAGAKNVIRVDSSKELSNIKLLNSAKSIAVTSGASAPEYIIEGIIDYLRNTIDNLDIRNAVDITEEQYDD